MNAEARLLLEAIVGDESSGFLEIRCLPSRRQSFFPVAEIAEAAEYAFSTANENVYVGGAPRVRESGRNKDVKQGWIISADCDSDAALDALAEFRPAPSMAIETGGRTETGRPRLHAHWRLTEPLNAVELRSAKAALAARLGGDKSITDPARIWRVPGTTHTGTRARVTLRRSTGETFTADQVIGFIPSEVAKTPRSPHGVAFAEGERNTSLTSHAGLMRRNGASPEEIEAALLGLNGACDPPLGHAEVRRIATGMERYDPAVDKEVAPGVPVGEIVVTRLSRVERERVEWLFPNLVPRGEVTVLFGPGGLGKSAWTCLLASEIEGMALFASAEDSPERIRNRVEAAGGDREQVGIVEIKRGRDFLDSIALPADFRALERAIVASEARLLGSLRPTTCRLRNERSPRGRSRYGRRRRSGRRRLRCPGRPRPWKRGRWSCCWSRPRPRTARRPCWPGRPRRCRSAC